MSNRYMNIKTDNIAEVGKHKFEVAGLGLPPYRLTGMNENKYVACQGAPAQPGGTCDYCGNSIMFEFWCVSRDGKRFKVGCDCINRSGDEGLIRAYKQSPEMRRKNREARYRKDAVNNDKLGALLVDYKDKMASWPHPGGFKDRVTGLPLSYLDYFNWMRGHCGAAGKAALLRQTVKKLNEAV